VPTNHPEQARPVTLKLKLTLILRSEEQLTNDQRAVARLVLKVKRVEVLEVLAAVARILLHVREEEI